MDEDLAQSAAHLYRDIRARERTLQKWQNELWVKLGKMTREQFDEYNKLIKED